MKKYLNIFSLLLLFLCLTTKVEAVTNVNKDFCEEVKQGKQEYIFQCQDVEKQCSYQQSSAEGGDIYYVNITKNGGEAKISIGDQKDNYGITNWDYANQVVSTDSKEWYIKNKKCPKYVLITTDTRFNNKYYLIDKKTAESDIKKADVNIETIGYYTLISEATNVPKEQPSDQGTTNNDPDVDSCAGFKTEGKCKIGKTKNAGNFGCAWNEQYEFCSPTGLAYLSCGGTDAKNKDSIAYDIPVMVPRLTSYAITALKTITPVILIIIGMFQLIKAITSQNEDEMKKARSALIKKLIAAVMIFFIVAIVQFIVKQVADDAEQSSTESCFNCFINNNCKNAMYYTDGYGKCYKVSCDSKNKSDCEISCPVDKY